MDIRDKVMKLLALSKSPNEHEARQAMLKARELMVEHKLTSGEVDIENDRVVHLESDLTFSKRRNSWTLILSDVIAKNHCCRAFSRRRGGQQTRIVCIAGFSKDAEFCLQVIKYALGCINSWSSHMLTINRSLYSAFERRTITDSYAKGYIAGIYSTYKRQSEMKGERWALVTVVPDKVNKSIELLKGERIASGDDVVASVYSAGFSDGTKFTMRDKLNGEVG